MTGSGDDSEPSAYEQTIIALPGSRVHVRQHGDVRTGTRDREDGSPLARLRAISDAAVADCDIVALRGGDSVVRLGEGAYIRRSVEGRLLRRLTRPSVTALIGEAGQGKTALMWRLHQHLTVLGREPLLVPASLLLGNESTAESVSVDLISEALREGADGPPTVLLVDTLDLLLHDPRTRERVARLLSAAERMRVPTLVTSRPVEAHTLHLVDVEEGDATLREGRIGRITVHGYDRRERDQAISAYARMFYSPVEAAEVKRVLESASVRGLPLQEICGNPLALRLLFEIYAPDEMPPPDIDSIGLHDEYWLRRISTDDRGRHVAAPARDLTRHAEGAALSLLSRGAIESPRADLVGRVCVLTGGGEAEQRETATALDALRARGVLKMPPDSGRLRFFHQTFFEHAAARSVLALGDDAVRILLDRVHEDPHDLFYGEVAAQLILLTERRPVLHRRPGTVLPDWLKSGERALRILALRTYARMPDPPAKLRKTASTVLRECEVDAATEFLRLLPSVRHGSFERVRADLEILWRRAVPKKPASEDDGAEEDERNGTGEGGRTIALTVIDVLSRFAPSHLDGVHDFVTEHGCVSWLRGLPLSYWRNNDSGYLRLLEPLYACAPRSYGPLLAKFFSRFCADSVVDGAAEIIEMLDRHPRHLPDTKTMDAIVADVGRFSSDESAERLEVAYADWRAPWFAGSDATDLVVRTRRLLKGGEYSAQGRRAELRALCRAALRLGDDDAKDYLDALLKETDRTRQEHLSTLLGEALAMTGDPIAPLIRYTREVCRQELARLPAQRNPDGSRPIPLLFVNALYNAQVGGDGLHTTLPQDVPAGLWTDPFGLMPLLTPAALAGHPDAVEALHTALHEPDGGSGSVSKVRRAVLGRLRNAVQEGVPQALDQLIDYAEASGSVTELCDVLQRQETTGRLPFADHRDRLDAVRQRLVASDDPRVVASGYKVWRLLIEKNLGASVEPERLAAELRRHPAHPLLIRLLELGLACLRSGHWFMRDVTVLVDALSPNVSREQVHRHQKAGHTAAAERASPVERQARRLLIGLRARHVPLAAGAVERREQATSVLALVRGAGYDLDEAAEHDTFTACVAEVGRLVERIGDPVTMIDLILDTAGWLSELPVGSLRFRRRTAQAWSSAITAAVAGASTAECQRLVEGLLGIESYMARLAVAACVDRIRPVPVWLLRLSTTMPPQVRKRMREVLNRNRRDGSVRSLEDLYTMGAARPGQPAG